MSKTDCHLLRQKVSQKISVIKANTFDGIKKIVHFGILEFIYFQRPQNFVKSSPNFWLQYIQSKVG